MSADLYPCTPAPQSRMLPPSHTVPSLPSLQGLLPDPTINQLSSAQANP